MGRPRGKSDPGALDAMTRCRLWLTTAALAVAGCAGPFPQSTLRPRSDFGRAIDHLFTDIFWWAVIVFVLVEALLLIALVRFATGGTPGPEAGAREHRARDRLDARTRGDPRARRGTYHAHHPRDGGRRAPRRSQGRGDRPPMVVGVQVSESRGS